MSYFKDKYSTKTNKYTFKCENPIYTNLKEVFSKNGPEKVYKVRALYLAEKGKFPHPVAVVDDGLYVDLPKHMLDQVKDMRADSVATDLINSGKCGFTVYEYDSDKRAEKCYGVDFCDIEPEPDDDLPFPVGE